MTPWLKTSLATIAGLSLLAGCGGGGGSGGGGGGETPGTLPVAEDVTLQLAEDSSAVVPFVIPEGASLTALPTPTVGVLVEAAGVYTYTPPADYYGSASFNYSLTNNVGTSDPATVSITVDAVADELRLVSGPLPSEVLVGVPWTYTVTVIDPDDLDAPARTATVTVSGSVPSGMSVDGSTVNWTPSEVGRRRWRRDTGHAAGG
jgi:hypothetical protein